MRIFYFDSSALAKGDIKEKGSVIVERILENTAEQQWRVLMIGLLETISIFVRKKNNKVISQTIFQSALRTFKNDFLDNLKVFKVEATNDLILVSADQRLLTAAKAERLQVINPETATLAEIEQLLQADSPAQSHAE